MNDRCANTGQTLALVHLIALLATGCSFATMTPAHKLDKGQAVVQGAIDEPGFLFVPRVSGQVTFGMGGADLGLHLGTTALTVNAGGTARAYLGKTALTLQAEGIITTFEDGLFSSGTRFGFLNVTPRVGRLLGEGESVYYGAQIHGILPFNISDGADLPSGPGFAFGGYIGYAWDSPGNIDLQAELSAAPIGVFPGIYAEGEDQYGIGLTPIVQLGFGVQYRREKERAPAAPTPDNDQIL